MSKEEEEKNVIRDKNNDVASAIYRETKKKNVAIARTQNIRRFQVFRRFSNARGRRKKTRKKMGLFVRTGKRRAKTMRKNQDRGAIGPFFLLVFKLVAPASVSRLAIGETVGKGDEGKWLTMKSRSENQGSTT